MTSWEACPDDDARHALACLEADQLFENVRGNRHILFDELRQKCGRNPCRIRDEIRRLPVESNPAGVLIGFREVVLALCVTGSRLFKFNLDLEIKKDRKIEELDLSNRNDKRKAILALIDCHRDLTNFSGDLSGLNPWFWATSTEMLPRHEASSKVMRRLGLPLYEDIDDIAAVDDSTFDVIVRIELKSRVNAISLYVPTIFESGGFEWFMPFRDSLEPRHGLTVDASRAPIGDGIPEWILPAGTFSSLVDSLDIMGFVHAKRDLPPFLDLVTLLEGRISHYRERVRNEDT